LEVVAAKTGIPLQVPDFIGFILVASSGIEPELSALRGRRVNQLHHDATQTVV
jgi:hypothetical protein